MKQRHYKQYECIHCFRNPCSGGNSWNHSHILNYSAYVIDLISLCKFVHDLHRRKHVSMNFNFLFFLSPNCRWSWWFLFITNANFNKVYPILSDAMPIISYDIDIDKDAHLSHVDDNWGRYEMAAILHTTVSNAFSWVKVYEFRLKFHWSLFIGV